MLETYTIYFEQKGGKTMNLSFYSAAIGASMQMKHMDVTANNVSNVNTYGYKSEVAGFANLMYGYFEGAEEEMSYRGAGTMMVQASANYADAPIQETGRTFDFAITGDGFFAVYDPATEEVTFIRDGSFTLAQTTYTEEEIAANAAAAAEAEGEVEEDEEGVEGEEEVEESLPDDAADFESVGWRLSDNSGRFVLDQDGNFIDIDPEVDYLLHTPESLNIGVFDFAIKDGLMRNGPSGFLNSFFDGEKNGEILEGTGIITQFYIETSNVDLAKEMTKLIEAQRLYTYALKMVTTSDEIETTINGLPA